MPLINKCRIVNFRYNNGKRLIADELFDFCNSSNNSITNTLIDMANGVGKTVMVQLMLQPIIPNAKFRHILKIHLITHIFCLNG